MRMGLRLALVSAALLGLSLQGLADDAKASYKDGLRAEANNDCDAAYKSFLSAKAMHPNEAKYVSAFLRARACAAYVHIGNGVKLRDEKKLAEAATEFQKAVQIDETNFLAAQELRRTITLIKKQAELASSPTAEATANKAAPELEGPIELAPSPNTPISLRLTTTADNVYRTIGKLGGISVLFDLDYKPQKITIELNEVMLKEALKMVALESKTYWRAISPTAVFVTSEAKRKEYENNVMRTFYLQNTSTAGELQEVVGTLKGILDISRIQVNPTHNAITLRGTPDQLVLAEKLISGVDKPKPEVMIDIAVLEISRERLRNLGTAVPTSTTISLQSLAPGAALGNLVKIGSLNGSSFVVEVPSATFTALMSDSKTKILQKPQLRALDNEKATLKIGDRIPVATGSFSPGTGGGGINALVNTQFQYLDVGVNIDITPHVHSDKEVTLKMVLEISSKTGEQNIGGITQPVIGQRRIEHETRLQDGELNLVGGILEDSETTSLSGYPWLTQIPILKYLFGQENKDRQESEIVFAILPHIVRGVEITDENAKLIDVGTASTIGLHYKEQEPSKAASHSGATAGAPVAANKRRQPAAAATTPPVVPGTTLPSSP